MLAVLGDSHTIALREGFQRIRSSLLRDVAMVAGARVARWGPVARVTEGHRRLAAAVPILSTLSMRPKTVSSIARSVDIRVGQIDHGYAFHQPFYRVNADGLHFTEPLASRYFRRLVSPTPAHIRPSDPRTFVICAGFYPSGALLERHWLTHTCHGEAKGERQYVSRAAYHALVRDYTAPLLRFLLALRALDVRFSVVASPPLSRNALQSWQTRTVSDAEVAALHTEFRSAFADELDRRGIRYHLPPAAVYDGDGYLRQELASTRKRNDYHANSDYGALMMAHLLGELDADGLLST